eukprot:24084-Pelagococcus_subviridis.AAC.1
MRHVHPQRRVPRDRARPPHEPRVLARALEEPRRRRRRLRYVLHVKPRDVPYGRSIQSDVGVELKGVRRS